MDFDNAPSTKDILTSDDLLPRYGVPAGSYKVVVEGHRIVPTRAGEALSLDFRVIDGEFQDKTFSELYFVNADKTKFSYKKAIGNLAQIQFAALGGDKKSFANWDIYVDQIKDRKFVVNVTAEVYENGQYKNIRNNVQTAFTYQNPPQHRDGIPFEKIEPQVEKLKQELAKEPKEATKKAEPKGINKGISIAEIDGLTEDFLTL